MILFLITGINSNKLTFEIFFNIFKRYICKNISVISIINYWQILECVSPCRTAVNVIIKNEITR